MKKYISFLVTLTMLAGIIGMPAYAWQTRVRAIPSVRITVNVSDLNVGDELSYSAESYISVPDNAYYELDDAEWIDEVSYLRVGDQPRMRVYLTAIPKETSGSNYDTVWLFQNSYNSSNVHISKGEFINADRRDSGYSLEVTLRINAVNGRYEEPMSVYWADSRGMGTWAVDENDSGYYDIICYRGSSAVKKLSSYHGNSYNFYPYMTREGDYSFKVRTVPAPGGTGRNSDWVESGSIYIDKEHVSDGTGQTTADEAGGAPVGLLVVRMVADHAVERGEDVANLVERGVHRVRPGELAVVAQALGAPVGEDVAAEGGQDVRAAAVAEDAHRRVEPLVPGGDELRVVDAAVSGLGRLLVGEDEPVGQVVVGRIDHRREVVQGTLRAGAQVEVLVVHGVPVGVGLASCDTADSTPRAACKSNRAESAAVVSLCFRGKLC